MRDDYTAMINPYITAISQIYDVAMPTIVIDANGRMERRYDKTVVTAVNYIYSQMDQAITSWLNSI